MQELKTTSTVLNLVRNKPEWSKEILDLAIELRDKGIVGIGIVGDTFGVTSAPNEEHVQNGRPTIELFTSFELVFKIVFIYF